MKHGFFRRRWALPAGCAALALVLWGCGSTEDEAVTHAHHEDDHHIAFESGPSPESEREGLNLTSSADGPVYRIPLRFIAFNERLGRELLTFSSRDEGYNAWMRSGFNQYFNRYLNPDQQYLARNALCLDPASGGSTYRTCKSLGQPVRACTDADYSHYVYTPCMVNALVHASELDFRTLGINLQYEITALEMSAFAGYDIRCEGQETCLHSIANKFHRVDKDNGKGLVNILLTPRMSRSVFGYMTGGAFLAEGKTTLAMVAGRQQAWAILSLFRHEISHALGFNGHHRFNGTFTFNADGIYPECPAITVPSYEELHAAGRLQPGCEHMAIVSNFVTSDEEARRGVQRICTRQWMDHQTFFDTKYTVPIYDDIYRDIFSCYLSYNANGGRIPDYRPDPGEEIEPFEGYCKLTASTGRCNEGDFKALCADTCEVLEQGKERVQRGEIMKVIFGEQAADSGYCGGYLRYDQEEFCAEAQDRKLCPNVCAHWLALEEPYRSSVFGPIDSGIEPPSDAPDKDPTPDPDPLPPPPRTEVAYCQVGAFVGHCQRRAEFLSSCNAQCTVLSENQDRIRKGELVKLLFGETTVDDPYCGAWISYELARSCEGVIKALCPDTCSAWEKLTPQQRMELQP